MKRIKYVICLLVAMALTSCLESSTVMINEIEKPAIVYSKYISDSWYKHSKLILKDAKGNLISITTDAALEAYIRKYNVGDTIK